VHPGLDRHHGRGHPLVPGRLVRRRLRGVRRRQALRLRRGGCDRLHGRRLHPALDGHYRGAVHSSPAVAEGVVYVGSDDGKLYAFDAAGVTGCTAGVCTPLWTATTGSKVQSSPAVAEGVVYVGSDDGKLYAFDAAV